MFRCSQFRALMLVVLVLSSLNACTTVKKKLDFDTELTLHFIVSPDANPDDNRRASPVFVRFYQLKNPNQFDNLGFIDLYEHDQELLGDDLIHASRLKEFVPDEKRTLEYKLDLASTHVALFAEFVQFQNSQDRLVLPIQNRSHNEFTIMIIKNQLKLVQSD